MAWLEKDHNGVSTPLLCAGRQPPDQAAQSHIQPGLECLQGWGIHSLLGQRVLGLDLILSHTECLSRIHPKPIKRLLNLKYVEVPLNSEGLNFELRAILDEHGTDSPL